MRIATNARKSTFNVSSDLGNIPSITTLRGGDFARTLRARPGNALHVPAKGNLHFPLAHPKRLMVDVVVVKDLPHVPGRNVEHFARFGRSDEQVRHATLACALLTQSH